MKLTFAFIFAEGLPSTPIKYDCIVSNPTLLGYLLVSGSSTLGVESKLPPVLNVVNSALRLLNLMTSLSFPAKAALSPRALKAASIILAVSKCVFNPLFVSFDA